jgi:NAD(P)H-flavin reductase
VKRVVFVAGGVGINPLMSILSHLAEADRVPYDIRFIYSFRHDSQESTAKMLFEQRLIDVFAKDNIEGELAIHRTSGGRQPESNQDSRLSEKLVIRDRKVKEDDVLQALGSVEDRVNTICYICGVPTMTDYFVEVARKAEGMNPDSVLFERWW